MPMHHGGEVDKEVVSRRGRYGEVAENLQVKEVVVGEWQSESRSSALESRSNVVGIAVKCCRNRRQMRLEFAPSQRYVYVVAGGGRENIWDAVCPS